MRKELNEKLPGFGKAAPRPNPTRVPDDDTAEYDDEDAKVRPTTSVCIHRDGNLRVSTDNRGNEEERLLLLQERAG